jgi:peptidoglycan/LPS O-acetylase OafA/YrhL
MLGLEKAFSYLHPSVFSGAAFVVTALVGANLIGLSLYTFVERPMNQHMVALAQRWLPRAGGRASAARKAQGTAAN